MSADAARPDPDDDLRARLAAVLHDEPRDGRRPVPWITDVTRTAILSGVVRPGERLRQQALASVFRTSRMPVREALNVLEAEGLVQSEPRRGFTVRSLDAEDVDEIYDLRALLESEAVRIAIPRLTREDLAELETLHERMVRASTPEAKAVARDRYHLRLYAASGRPRLVELITSLRKETARAGRWPGLQDSHRIHDHIFHAVRDSDVDEAVAHLTTHYELVARLIRRYLRETDAAGGPAQSARSRGTEGPR